MYLELNNISKRYPDAKPGEPDAVSKVSLGIEKGELIALLGPSGSGKTTLLRMIAGLDAPSGGEIYIDGNCVNDLIPVSDEGTVREVFFRGDSIELTIEVNGARLMCRRSLERRPVKAGEKMRVLLYRINAFGEDGGEVIVNNALKDVKIEFM